MPQRLLLILSLALLFGLGQQATVTHAVSHLAEWQEEQHDHLPHSPHCKECAAYAGLGSALADRPWVMAVATPATERPALAVVAVPGASCHTYSARAPPAVLA